MLSVRVCQFYRRISRATFCTGFDNRPDRQQFGNRQEQGGRRRLFEKSVNEIQLLGRTASKPLLKRDQRGESVTLVKLVTHEMFVGPDGNRREVHEYHRVVVFLNSLQMALSKLGKGSRIMVKGRLTYTPMPMSDQPVASIRADELITLSANNVDSGRNYDRQQDISGSRFGQQQEHEHEPVPFDEPSLNDDTLSSEGEKNVSESGQKVATG